MTRSCEWNVFVSQMMSLFVFEVASVPQKLIDGYSKAEITESLYRTLEEKGGKKIGPANQTITAVLASEKIADYLEVKRGDAVLRLRQISYFEDGTPFEYVRTQYVEIVLSFIWKNKKQVIPDSLLRNKRESESPVFIYDQLPVARDKKQDPLQIGLVRSAAQ